MKHFNIHLHFDAELLDHFGVSDWNAFHARLLSSRLLDYYWVSGEAPPLLNVTLDFSCLDRSHYNLDGIDLSCCNLDGADFTGASLRNARISGGMYICFQDADLHGVDFSHNDVSGSVFSGAKGLESVNWDNAYYHPERPPSGLPPEILDRLHTEDIFAGIKDQEKTVQNTDVQEGEDDIAEDEFGVDAAAPDDCSDNTDDGRPYRKFSDARYEADPDIVTECSIPVSAIINSVPLEESVQFRWKRGSLAADYTPAEYFYRAALQPTKYLKRPNNETE